MGKFLFALPMALILAQGAWGDTTFTITATPYNPSALITYIQSNDDSSLVITLKNGMGAGADTVRLTTRILVSGRPAGNTVVTHLRGEGRTAGSPLILTENTGATDPLLIDFQAGNRGILSNMNLVRRLNNHSNHSVSIAAKGTVIRDCHFFRSDNGSQVFGSLVFVNADSVLVERNLFRAPPNGKGSTIALYSGASATRSEYRSNIFYSTGLYLVGGTSHIFANTFAGSRDDFNAIIVSSSLTTSNTVDRAVNIQHNLFALKADTLAPILFGSATLTASDSIQKNAWSRSRTNLPLAVNGAGAALLLNNTTGGNGNVVLPKGFSRYGPHVAQFKEYPMVTLRSDESLPRGSADFGVIPRVYNSNVSAWTLIPDIATGLPSNKLYFPNNTSTVFTPFLSGKSWSSSAGIKVGSLVDIEARITPPSPLDSGGMGRGLTIVRHPTDTTKMRISMIDFDPAFYDTLIPPGDMWFFFHTTPGRLAANDSAGLKHPTTGTPYYYKKDWLEFDSILTVPEGVRTGNAIYVKMLHYNAGGQATVLASSGAIAQVSGIPSYPINDLGVPTVDPTSVIAAGTFVIKVAKLGGETIDSVRVDVQRVGGGVEYSKSVAAPARGSSATFNFQLPKGEFKFTATPVASVGAVFQDGPPTAPSPAYLSMLSAGDTVLVIHKSDTTGCGNRSGSPSNDALAFCNLDYALADLKAKGSGGTILVKNGTPAVPFQGVTLSDTGSTSIIITVPTVNGVFDPAHRAVFRGSAGKEALVIARRNVTLRGFIIEMPAGASGAALTVQPGATGVNVDGCVFRPVTNAAAGGPAISIGTGGNGEMRFLNNVVWGYSSGVRINSTSPNIRILHNTFIEEASHASPMTGILVPAATSSAVIANNYFSGILNPYDASATGKDITLDHNGYPSRQPRLMGLFEVGSVDSIPRLGALDLTQATWSEAFRAAMEAVTNCDAVKECFELYAGSSADSYGPAITTDVLGRPRAGKPEVGALEAEATSTGVRGVLIMEVRALADGAPGADDRLVFTVTRRTYDPADPDSVYVWWSTNRAASLTDTIPAGSQRKYPISVLNSAGAFTDTASGLDPDRTYFIAASLGRNPTQAPGGRIVGYPYRDSATTRITVSTDDCVYGLQNEPICPQQGYFVSPSAPNFQTRVDFALPDTGYVKVPEFLPPPGHTYARGKVEMSQVLPVIKLSLRAAKAGLPGSKQSWKASIRMAENPAGTLDQNKLFILPADSTGLPTYVPSWRLRQDGASGWVIEIEGTGSGEFKYGFGRLVDEPGAVTIPGNTTPVFSFKTTPRNDSASVTVKFSGTGFSTQNPLILITPIPAGGTYPNPMDGQYPNRTLMLSSGLSGLDDSLRRDLFQQYYQAAVSVDSNEALSPAAPGTRKPFQLSPVAPTAFVASTILTTPSVVVSDAGDLQETTLQVPIWREYADTRYYRDRISRMTRSIELVFTTFDGAKISRSSAYVQTEFADTLQTTEVEEFPSHVWNLHAYPWDEADTGSLARIFERTAWSKDELRLMKYKGTGSGPSAYIIYEGGDASGITVDAGQAVWTAATEFYEPRTSGGRSLDYKPFRMRLKAGEWNDIGLPFNFPMKWADVLRASNLDAATFKVWKYTAPDGNQPATWGIPLTANTVVHPWEGLTVRPAAADTILQFPIVDSSRSTTALAKPSAGDMWTAVIRAYNATASMSLRIGKGASENRTAEAPDVPGQDFRVGLKRLGPVGPENLSEFIQAGDDWRGHWSLSGRASKDGIRLAVAENRGKTPLYLVELLGRKSVPLAPGSETSLSEEELKNGDYHIVAGDSRYLEDVLAGLVPMHMLALANFPNPFSHATLIRYALPESYGKVEFRLKVRDSRGRLVWEKSIRGSNTLHYQWDGRDGGGKAVGAGFYTLSLEALAPGKAPQRAVRRMLKF